MNKSNKILIIIASSLLLIIFIHWLKPLFKKPKKIKEIKVSINKVVIDNPKLEIRHVFVQKDQVWFLGEKKYEVDKQAISNVLIEIKKSRKIELVSELDSDFKYNLGSSNRVKVEVFNDNKLIRTLFIGKESATYHYRYLKYDKNPFIYQTMDTFKGKFELSTIDFRNKEIFSFAENEVTSIKIEDLNKNVLVISKEIPNVNKVKESKKDKDSVSFVWQDSLKRHYEGQEITAFINILGNLKVDSFLEETSKSLEIKKAKRKITVNTTEKVYELIILNDKKENKDQVYTLSKKYAFIISASDAEVLNGKFSLLSIKEGTKKEGTKEGTDKNKE